MAYRDGEAATAASPSLWSGGRGRRLLHEALRWSVGAPDDARAELEIAGLRQAAGGSQVGHCAAMRSRRVPGLRMRCRARV